MNAKRGIKNILTSILSQGITLLLGIMIPRLVIVGMGSESNGLLSSINQVLVYVSLLEAGIGTASLQALYQPVAEKDRTEVNSVLAAANTFYLRAGKLYIVAIVVLAVVFPYTIQTSLRRTSVVWIVLLSGLPGAFNLLFQGKYRILLQAEGKDYIYTTVYTVIHILAGVSKIALLLAGFDLVALQAVYLGFSVVQIIAIRIYIERNYAWINLKVSPNYGALKQSKNVVVHQLSGLVFNQTDVMILTYFCGLKTVSVYSMYSMLLNMVDTMVGHFSGINFILGQAFNTEKKKYLKYHDIYELYMMTLSFGLFSVAALFILPFLERYTYGVSDVKYIDKYLPFMFIAIYLLSKGRTASMLAINFAKHFKQTQSHAIIEMTLNLVISLFTVCKIGIYGVLLGTVVALLYRTNAMILYANRKILNRSPWITYRRWLLNLALFILVTAGGKWFFASVALDTYPRIIFWAAVSCVVIVPLFFVVVSLFDRETYHFAKELLTPYLHRFTKKGSQT